MRLKFFPAYLVGTVVLLCTFLFFCVQSGAAYDLEDFPELKDFSESEESSASQFENVVEAKLTAEERMREEFPPLFYLTRLDFTGSERTYGAFGLFGFEKELAKFPERTENLEGFLPTNWVVMDELRFDYDGDGMEDIVAVLERQFFSRGEPLNFRANFPRLFFAASGMRSGGFKLDTLDGNMVSGNHAVGLTSDPYVGIAHVDGGITIKHCEESFGRNANDIASTYQFGKNKWLLMEEDHFYFGENDAYRSETKNNYREGVGTRFEYDMDENEEPFVIDYSVKLDAPPTAHPGREYRAPVYQLPNGKKSVGSAIMIDLNKVLFPNETYAYIEFQTETKLVFSQRIGDEETWALSIYDNVTADLLVLHVMEAWDISPYFSVKIYGDKLYYYTTVDEKSVIYALNLDGSGQSRVYEADFSSAQSEGGFESFGFDILGGEIILETGFWRKTVYRMDLRGNILEVIEPRPPTEEELELLLQYN